MKTQLDFKTIALSLLFSSATLLTNAQVPNIQWQKTIGGAGDDANNFGKITSLKDGNYLIVGETNSTSINGKAIVNRGDFDAVVIKFKASGKIIWAKTYGGSLEDVLNGVVENHDHSLTISGATYSNDGDVSGNHGDRDAWVIKLSPKGTLLSQHCFGGTAEDFSNDMVRTNGNKYAFTGWTHSNDGDVSNNHGGSDGWVVYLNSNLSVVWSKSVGGSGDDGPSGMLSTSNSKIIIAGSTNSNDGDFISNHGDQDAFSVELNSAGNILWSKCYGGTATDYSGFGIGIAKDGNLLIDGMTNSNDGDVSGNHGGYDTWVTKVNNVTGNIIWSKCFGTSAYEYGYGIMTLRNGDLVSLGITGPNDDIFGDAFSDAQAIRLDKNGNQIWSKTFGGSDWDDAEDGVPTSEGGMLLLCHTLSNDGDVTNNHGGTDLWLVQLDGEEHHDHRDGALLENNFALSNSPNPISTVTSISFMLPQAENCLINIYDLSGKAIATLCENKLLEAGAHTIKWNVEGIDAGIYFLKFNAGDYAETKEMLIVK